MAREDASWGGFPALHMPLRRPMSVSMAVDMSSARVKETRIQPIAHLAALDLETHSTIMVKKA